MKFKAIHKVSHVSLSGLTSIELLEGVCMAESCLLFNFNTLFLFLYSIAFLTIILILHEN